MERKKVWSKKEVFKLIARYEHYRELWDTRSIEFRDTFKRRKAENKLAAEFKTTVAEIGRKIRILRSQFFYEYKKMYDDDEAEDGSSSQSAYVTKWAYYRPLQFILVAREDSSDNANLMDQDRDFNTDLSTQNDNDSNASNLDEDTDSKIVFVSKKRRRSDSSSESSVSESVQNNEIPNDKFQIFGNYVASELRSMHYEKNIKELKRLIQQHIVRWTEEDDREYFSN